MIFRIYIGTIPAVQIQFSFVNARNFYALVIHGFVLWGIFTFTMGMVPNV